MKGKLIFAIILSAILLTACNSGETEISETSAESSITAVSETSPVTTVTTAETVSETSAETTIAETLPPVVENIGEGVSLEVEVKKLDDFYKADRHMGRLLFFGDIAAISPRGGSDGRRIVFLDIDGKAVKAEITLPDGWTFAWDYTCARGDGEDLCRIKICRYTDEFSEEYGVLAVKNDFSFEIIEDEPEKNLAIPVCGHRISDIPYNIYDADSGETLVEGFRDLSEYEMSSRCPVYEFAADGDRFVYKVIGYEGAPCFGCYDFAKGKAADFPDSWDFNPVGAYGGKIYGTKSPWNAVNQGELYTFDMETLEKEYFMPAPAETDGGFWGYTSYYMPEHGEYIAALHPDFQNGITEVYIFSSESGETLSKCTLNADNIVSEAEFIGDNKFAFYDNHSNEIFIFTVNF